MFRFARLASFVLFMALLSVNICAQSNDPHPSQRQKFDHKLKITTKYNRSSDSTGVQFFLKEPNSLVRLAGGGDGYSADPTFGEDIGISASFSHPGRVVSQAVDEAMLWVAYIGGARAAITSELSAMVDGRKLVLSSQVHQQGKPDRQKGIQVRSLMLTVTRDHLTQLANGSKVVLVLPSREHITLTREQRNALADFTSRMSP